MVLNYIDKNKTIKRADVADLCRISPQQATRLLKHLIESQDIKLVGDSEGTRYERITEIIVRIRSVAFDYARFRSIACTSGKAHLNSFIAYSSTGLHVQSSVKRF